MGGRKSSSISIITGNNPSLNHLKGNLTTSLKKEDVTEITLSSIKLLASSPPAMLTLVYGLELLKFYNNYENQKLHSRDYLIAQIAHDWIKYKAQKDIKTTKEIDRMYITTFINHLKNPSPDFHSTATMFFADILYKQLLSTVRSQNSSLYFYSINIPKQKEIEKQYKLFSIKFSNKFMDKYNKQPISIRQSSYLASKLLLLTMEGDNGKT